jgi:hypothetical protein
LPILAIRHLRRHTGAAAQRRTQIGFDRVRRLS